MKKRNSWSIILYLAILALVCWLLISLFTGVGNEVAYSEVVNLFQKEQVESFVVSDGVMHLRLKALMLFHRQDFSPRAKQY